MYLRVGSVVVERAAAFIIQLLHPPLDVPAQLGNLAALQQRLKHFPRIVTLRSILVRGYLLHHVLVCYAARPFIVFLQLLNRILQPRILCLQRRYSLQ